MTDIDSTHAVEVCERHVTKRFRSGDDGGSERDWRALELLTEYAPGLAPDPISSELGTANPLIRMSRLPGEPLSQCALDDKAISALAEALTTLYAAVPSDVLAEVAPRPGRQHGLAALLRHWAPSVQAGAQGEIREAIDLGLRWLEGSGMEEAPSDVPEIFGPGDGSLDNYLWDGSRVRVIDFEDSGRSDRAFELAEITEHVASWVDRPLDVALFLGKFTMTPAESARLQDCRRLIALLWLCVLAADEAAGAPTNPFGTAERQARRLTALHC